MILLSDMIENVASTEVAQEVEQRIGVFQEYLNTLPQKALNLGIRVLLALLFFLIGMQIIKIIRRIVKKSLSRANADVGVIQFLDSLIKAVLYIILIFMIASGFGLDATSVVAVVGSAGVAVGLALQGSLSNFAGGVLILLLKPFKVGDYIKEDNKGNEGTVTEIELFYTKLTTPDEKVVILPNGSLANSSLTNFTQTQTRRLDIIVGISYEADLKKAKELAFVCLEDDPAILKDCEQSVFVSDLGDSAVLLTLRGYVVNQDYWTCRSRILEAVKLCFDENEIAIPYQQMDVHLTSGES